MTAAKPPVNSLIRSDIWKKERTRMANRIRRRFHIQETYLRPEQKFRYDYVVTSAEITAAIEEVMRDTERLCVYALQEEAAAGRAGSK